MSLIQNYGQERERIATESELEIFDCLKALPGCEALRLVRKSDNYVTAVLGDWDLAQFKYTPRAKWITFPVLESNKNKHTLDEPSDAADFANMVADSVAHIAKYQ